MAVSARPRRTPSNQKRRCVMRCLAGMKAETLGSWPWSARILAGTPAGASLTHIQCPCDVDIAGTKEGASYTNPQNAGTARRTVSMVGRVNDPGDMAENGERNSIPVGAYPYPPRPTGSGVLL